MSVVGIDFGAQSTKIGVARNKGIDIVRLPLSVPLSSSENLRLRWMSLVK
jgi:RNase H-fold protein (predicted Holliday junction resolvase)